MRLVGGERGPRGVDEILGAGSTVLRRQGEHPRESPGHAVGERAVVTHRGADELRGELQHTVAAVGLTLRHEHKIFAVTAGHRHRVILSLGEHLG